MTTTDDPHTLRAFPSLSILQRPDHSPSFLFESTRINGIWCSLHRAVISFLYCGSSQLSAKMHRTAWRLYNGGCLYFNQKLFVQIFVQCNLLVQSFTCLMNAMHKTISNERFLQNFLKSGINVHFAIDINDWSSWCTGMIQLPINSTSTNFGNIIDLHFNVRHFLANFYTEMIGKKFRISEHNLRCE